MPFTRADREAGLRGTIRWDAREYREITRSDMGAPGEVLVTERVLDLWIARLDEKYGPRSPVAAAHFVRAAKIHDWLRANRRTLESRGVFARAGDADEWLRRATLLEVLCERSYEALATGGDLYDATFDLESVCRILATGSGASEEQAERDLVAYEERIVAAEKLWADHWRLGHLGSELRTAVGEWRMRAAPLLSSQNRRSTARPAVAWLKEEFTSHRNYILEWWPFHPGDFFMASVLDSDFLEFTNERRGGPGNYGDPFNRLVMIRGAGNLRGRESADVSLAFEQLKDGLREEIVAAAGQAGVTCHVAETLRYDQAQRHWTREARDVPGTSREAVEAQAARSREIWKSVLSKGPLSTLAFPPGEE